ncbi:TlpA family protein disulfide reductase [Catalinimonas niigatensis]|uniref:TlpA family protein disulfide reductase n=1 Tax=Catalinimonas niigatensis TaxID=1397264 RepID=UPI002665B54D|nr:TlpA disulfide reductase family protein [Catalinimonas niigatensis]WPP51287.1 TlpA disulfide reductase family protein [Catalinimonas niigatensis]
MLLKKLRKNIDWIVFVLFISVVYLGGWQTEVFGFMQRGILATGFFNAQVNEEINENKTNLDFILSDRNEGKLYVSSLKGKTIFINLWATWCPPCIAEMPGINALYKDVKHREDIVFIMLSLDENKDKAKAFMDKKLFDFPLYFLSSALPKEFNHQSIPTTFVISPEGKIIFQKEGMASYNTDAFRNFLLTL